MSTVLEIQDAIKRLSSKERLALTVWLESQEPSMMSERDETALLARLDLAAKELDAGKGISSKEVHGMIKKWATQ